MLLTNENCHDLKTGDYNISNTYIFIRHDRSPDRPGVTGSFRHLYTDIWTPYKSISDLIYQLELFLEQIDIPQSNTECRKFWKKAALRSQTDTPVLLLNYPVWPAIQAGEFFYIIHIKYRQNSSWQGELRWLNQNKTQSFQSVLELIMLLEGHCL